MEAVDKSRIVTDDLKATALKTRALVRELVRRRVLEDGRLDILAREVLGYTVRPFHREMLEFQSAHDHCLQLAPRGFGKTSLLTVCRCVFEIIRNPNIRILIASNTERQAAAFLREIKFHLAENPKVLAFFGSFADGAKWHETEIIVAGRRLSAKEPTVTAIGVGGPIASKHYDMVVADDLVDQDSRSEAQREKLQTWFYKTLTPVLEPHGRLFVIGTRYHHLDLYGHLIKNEYAEAHQIIPAIYPDGSTPWPEKFSLEWLDKKRAEMGSIIFNSQYQNDTSLMKGHIFKEEWFRYYEKEPDWDSMSFFVGCDPAATKRDSVLSSQSANTDWWTIVVGAREVDDERDCKSDIYLKEVWRGRCTKEEYLTKLRELNEHYGPVSVVIETVAAQEYLAQDAERFMPVRRVNRTTDKVARAYWLQAFFENGQILFPEKSMASSYEDWQALIDELLLFPQSEHDDLFDGLQTMVEGAMKYGSGPRITLLG